MKSLRCVSGEIIKNKNLSENLVEFGNSMSMLHSGLAYIKLSMNYSTFQERLAELSDNQKDAVMHMQAFSELSGAIRKMLGRMTASEECEIDRQEVDAVRREIIKEMELITGIVDRLKIYEFVMNRVEYRFDDRLPDEAYYNQGLANDLMHYILADKDNVVINARIAEVVSQLPMRLARGKFLEYLKEAFSLYQGAQRGTVEDFIHNLSATAMIPELPGFATGFPQVHEIDKIFQNADFKHISGEEFKRMQGLMALATEEMENCADLFVMLATVINDLYTIVLAREGALGDVTEVCAARRAIARMLEMDGGCAMDEEMLDIFTGMEGRQEEIFMLLMSCDCVVGYALENCRDALEATGMLSVYEALEATLKLQSGSLFVPLEKNPRALEIMTNEELEETFAAFASRMEAVLKTHSQPVGRAVMAAVLGQLPVFFNSVGEIQEYINASLSRCSDVAERKACMEIMKMIMDDGN